MIRSSGANGGRGTRREVSSVVGTWTLIVSLLLLLAGHPLRASVIAGALVGVQAGTGLLLVVLVAPALARGFVARVALGSFIGFVAAACVPLVFLNTPLLPYAWIFPSIAVLIACILGRHHFGTVNGDERPSRITWLWLLLALIIGLSSEWTWLLPMVFVVFASGLCVTRKFRIVGLVVGALALIGQVVMISNRSPYWTQFRRGLSQVYDYVFFDATATATATWGGSENALIAGDRLAYHWLPYAWSGRIELLTGVHSTALSSHIIQITSFGLVVLLVFALVRRFGESETWGVVGSLYGALLVGSPLALLQPMGMYSPSQVFVSAAFLALILAIAEYLARPSFGVLVFAVAAGFAVVGGKVAALPALVALVGVASLVSLRSQNWQWPILLASAMALVTVGGFWYFFAGASVGETQSGSQLNLGDVVYSDGPMASVVRTPLLTIVGSVVLVVLLLSSVLGLFVSRGGTITREKAVLWGVRGAAATSLLTGFIYVGDRSGVMYFFQLALIVSLPLAIAGLSRYSFSALMNVRSMATIGVIAGVVALAWTNLYFEVAATDSATSLVRSMFLLFPLAGGVVASVVVRRSASARALPRLVTTAATTALIMGLAFFAWVPRYARLHVLEGRSLAEDRNLAVGSPLYREAFEWIRQNSDSDAIVATNRYCNDVSQSLPACTASLSMAAAHTQRRMWAENIDFVGGDKEKVLRRAGNALAFVNAPSAQSLAPLLSANVSWVFIDRQLTQQSDWEPWARVEFENDEAIVLRVVGQGAGS